MSIDSTSAPACGDPALGALESRGPDAVPSESVVQHCRASRQTGNLLLVMSLSVSCRTGPSESTLPMIGMLRRKPLRHGQQSSTAVRLAGKHAHAGELVSLWRTARSGKSLQRD